MSSHFSSRLSQIAISTLVFGALTLFFVCVSFERLLAGDEGYYVLASRLVMEGKIPYLDFFYPQMPFLPYVYGIWMKIFGFTWYGARSLSGVIAAILGLLIFENTKRKLGLSWAITSLVLYLTSSMIFPWLTVVKTYGLSTLCLFGSYLFLVDAKWIRPVVRYAISALLFQLAVSTRLFFVALLPIFIFWIIKEEKKDSRRNALVSFFAIVVVTALPYLYLMITHFDAFMFNNLGYHLMRDENKILLSRESRYKVGGLLLGFREGDQLVGYQFSILLLLTLVSLVFGLFKRRSFDLSACIAVVLIFVSFVPSPVYVQYFCTPVPFMIISSLEIVSMFLRSNWPSSNKVNRSILAIVIMVLLLEYVRMFPYDLNRFTNSGKGVIGVSGVRDVLNWRIDTVRSIGAIIDEFTVPGEEVVSLWPGHLFESHAAAVPGMENQFGVQVGVRLSKEKRIEYKILSRDDVELLITESKYRIIIAEKKFSIKVYGEALQRGGYSIVKSIEKTVIYQRNERS